MTCAYTVLYNNIWRQSCTPPTGSISHHILSCNRISGKWVIYIFRNTEFTFRLIYKCKFGSRQFQAILISESGCCTTNVKLVNSADPCERRPKVAYHRGLSCLLTINRMPLDRSAYWKNIFLVSHPNICCGYSKEPSEWDGSFEHQEHMFK